MSIQTTGHQPEEALSSLPTVASTRAKLANDEVNQGVIKKLQHLEVSEYAAYIPALVDFFRSKVSSFHAGQISSHLCIREDLTSDPEILETVAGQFIEFEQQPIQTSLPGQCIMSDKDVQIVDNEIKTLLTKGVIIPSQHEPCEFISPVFLRAKKDGSHRMILNLKSLNQFVLYRHFKMEFKIKIG